MRALARVRPWWIEEPTSPDDVLGHATIATGDRADQGRHRRDVPEPRDLQAAPAGGAIGYCQVDACRMGGVNEVLAVLLLAAKFGVPVCPHAGGVGLCEYVQHLAIFDYIAVSAVARGPRLRVRRPPARALRRPGARRGRALPGPARPRLLGGDEGSLARRPRVPGREGVERLDLRVVGGTQDVASIPETMSAYAG